MPTMLTIYFDSDGFKLVGSLHLPDRANAPIIIGSHGLLANRNSPKQVDLAKACNANGMAYFRFDHRGCGESQGQFSSDSTLPSRSRDLMFAVNTMNDHPAVGPCTGLFGSSFGGSVVMAYAADHDTPRLLTYAAPLNSRSIQHDNIRDSKGRKPASSHLPPGLAFDIEPNLKSIHTIFIVHSQNDETVPVEHAHKIYHSVDEPKSLHIFEGGDHRMSDENHQQQFNDLFIQWFKGNG